MTEAGNPILLSPDGVISFRGYGVSSSGVGSSSAGDTTSTTSKDGSDIVRIILFKKKCFN